MDTVAIYPTNTPDEFCAMTPAEIRAELIRKSYCGPLLRDFRPAHLEILRLRAALYTIKTGLNPDGTPAGDAKEIAWRALENG